MTQWTLPTAEQIIISVENTGIAALWKLTPPATVSEVLELAMPMKAAFPDRPLRVQRSARILARPAFRQD